MLRALSRLRPQVSMVRSALGSLKNQRVVIPGGGCAHGPSRSEMKAYKPVDSTVYLGGRALSGLKATEPNGSQRAYSNLGTQGGHAVAGVPADVRLLDLHKRIESAPVYDVATKTPLVKAGKISQRIGNQVFLKREDYQPGFSFKVRGAYTKLKRMHEDKPLCKVIAASAGNHAQGVALAAREMGIEADIVMPTTTPMIKVEAVKALGANVILKGQVFDDAADFARSQSAKDEIPFISPYDDWDIIAGQGTVGKEILDEISDCVHAIFVPVGGGGLIAGVAAWVKSVRPGVKVIGVEPENSNCLHTALENKSPVRLAQVDIFADGVAVKEIGGRPFEVCKQWVDEVICVGIDDICAATQDIFEESRAVPEPSGALALAGMKAYAKQTGIVNSTMVAVVSGGNLDFGKLEYVAKRATFLENRRALLGVTLEDGVGGLKRFLKEADGLKIEDLDYRCNVGSSGKAFVGVGMSPGLEEKTDLLERLCEAGMSPVDLSDSLLAVEHASCLGPAQADVGKQRLVRFEFLEKPGAVQGILKELCDEFCVTKIHYQNHSAAVGRLLVATAISSEDGARFEAWLQEIDIAYEEETFGMANKWFTED